MCCCLLKNLIDLLPGVLQELLHTAKFPDIIRLARSVNTAVGPNKFMRGGINDNV